MGSDTKQVKEKIARIITDDRFRRLSESQELFDGERVTVVKFDLERVRSVGKAKELAKSTYDDRPDYPYANTVTINKWSEICVVGYSGIGLFLGPVSFDYNFGHLDCECKGHFFDQAHETLHYNKLQKVSSEALERGDYDEHLTRISNQGNPVLEPNQVLRELEMLIPSRRTPGVV